MPHMVTRILTADNADGRGSRTRGSPSSGVIRAICGAIVEFGRKLRSSLFPHSTNLAIQRRNVFNVLTISSAALPRRVVRGLSGFGLAALCACTQLKSTAPRTQLARYEFTQPQMGVAFRIVLYAGSESKAESAAAAAFNRIKELNAIMSDYEPDSELSRLSATAGQRVDVPLSPDLWTILERSQALARRTAGAFDASVAPV